MLKATEISSHYSLMNFFLLIYTWNQLNSIFYNTDNTQVSLTLPALLSMTGPSLKDIVSPTS